MSIITQPKVKPQIMKSTVHRLQTDYDFLKRAFDEFEKYACAPKPTNCKMEEGDMERRVLQLQGDTYQLGVVNVRPIRALVSKHAWNDACASLIYRDTVKRIEFKCAENRTMCVSVLSAYFGSFLETLVRTRGEVAKTLRTGSVGTYDDATHIGVSAATFTGNDISTYLIICADNTIARTLRR